QDRHDEPRLQHPPAGSARANGSCTRLSALTGGVRVASCKGPRGRRPGVKTVPDRGLTSERALQPPAQPRQKSLKASIVRGSLQFPGEIDRVADASIHTLSAGGAVDMRGVAEQEGAALAEILRHAVVDAIGREPVDFLDFDLEIVDDPPADVLEFERISMPSAFTSHRADQPRASCPGQRKYREEVGLLEIGMEFAVDRWAGGLDIRD